MRLIKNLTAVILIITALFFSLTAYAEDKTHEVYGTLTTPDGIAAPGVEIKIYLDNCKTTRVTTDSNGDYKVSFEGSSHWFDAEYLDYVLCETVTTPADATEPVRKDLKLEYACLVLGEVVDASTSAPIEDARVWISGSYGADTNTGSDGVFKARVPKRAGMMLEVGKDGYVTSRMNFDTRDVPTTAWRVPLKPGGVVRGMVYDQNNQPIPGITVRILEDGTHSRSVKTDDTGHYEMRSVDPDRTAQMRVDDIRIPTTEDKSIEFPKGSMEATYDFTVSLEGRDPITITGRVTDTQGVPIEGARVAFGRSSYDWNKKATQTDAQGEYTLTELTREKDMILVQAEGYAPEFMPVGNTDGQRIDVTLEPPHSAEVLVVGPSGQPQPGVSMSVDVRTPVLKQMYSENVIASDVYHSLHNTKTDDNGKVILHDLPAEGVVVSLGNTDYIAPSNIAIRVDATDNVIKMQAAPQITGAVVDSETGNPVRCFTVKWMAVGVTSMGGDTNTTFNRPDGKFVIRVGDDRLLEKKDYTVRVLADGYVGEEKMISVTDAKAADYSIIFKLQKAYAMQGKVMDASGKGVAGAEVTVVENRGYLTFTVPPEIAPNAYQQKYTTGPDGSFTINPVIEKTAVIMVQKQGYSKMVEQRVDITKPVTLTLIEPTSITIKATGLISEGAKVYLTFVRNRCYSSLPWRELPADGIITWSDLEPGDYIVQVNGSVHSEMRVVGLNPGGEFTLDLDTERPVVVRGRVTRGGVPVRGMSVYIERGLNKYNSGAVSDADGRYEIKVEQPGPSELRYYMRENDEITIHQTMPVDLRLGENAVDIKLPMGSVSGRVFDAKTGHPLEGEQVEAWTKWKPSAAGEYDRPIVGGGYTNSLTTTVTSEDGSFTLGNLPAGQMLLSVRTQSQRSKYVGSPFVLTEEKPVKGVEIGMLEPGMLQVTVVDSKTGKPLGPMPVWLCTPDGTPVITDNRYADGTSVPGGKYVLWVEPSDGKHLPAYANVEIIPEKTAKVTLKVNEAGQRIVFRVPKGGALENLRWPDRDTRKYQANLLEEKEDAVKARPWIGYALSDAKTGKPVLMGPNGLEWGGYLPDFNSNREAVLPIKPGRYVLDAVLRNTEDYAVGSQANLWKVHREITVVARKDTVITVK